MNEIEEKGHLVQGKVITANKLVDGVVVYLAAGGAWTEQLAEARFLTDDSQQARLSRLAEKDVERLLIVDPYLMDAAQSANGLAPVSQRETIRATGPTIPIDFRTTHSEG